MNKILFKVLLLVSILFINANAQSYYKTELGIKSSINSTDIEIQFYSPTIVRVLKSPAGTTFTQKSLSVIKEPQKTNLEVNQDNNELILLSRNIRVNLNLNSGSISFSGINGEKLLNEKDSGCEFTEFNDAGIKTFSVYQSFVLDKDEAIYGLGQQQQGKMIQRDLKLNMIQGNTDDYIPFFPII